MAKKARKTKIRKARPARKTQARARARVEAKPPLDQRKLQQGIKTAVDQATMVEPKPQPFAPVLRGIVARFARALPHGALSSGTHEPEVALAAKGVPNGIFRVDGSDWLMHVKNGVVHLFEKAHADLDPKRVVAIPST